MSLSALARALGRWTAASIVGIVLVIALGSALLGGTVALAVVALALSIVPLLVARRWPAVGAWLAAALLAAAPFALVMARWMLDQPLVISRWRCGTGDAALWILVMPTAQALLALLAGALWRGRRRLARLWQPMTTVGVVVGMGLLLAGGVRTLQWGPASDVEWVLSRAEAVEIPGIPTDGASVVEVAGVVVERSCILGACEAGLRTTTMAASDEALHTTYETWSAADPVVVYVLGDFRVIEATPMPHRRGTRRLALDLRHPWVIDLHVADVADAFGPSPAALLLALVGLLACAGSQWLGGFAPLVWRRLGARRAERDAGHIDEVIALRMTHAAVLVVTALPLLASAWIGLVV